MINVLRTEDGPLTVKYGQRRAVAIGFTQMAQGSGIRAQGLGLRAQGSGLRAQGSGLRKTILDAVHSQSVRLRMAPRPRSFSLAVFCNDLTSARLLCPVGSLTSCIFIASIRRKLFNKPIARKSHHFQVVFSRSNCLSIPIN